MPCRSILLLGAALISMHAMAEHSPLPGGEPVAGVSRTLAAWRTAHYRDVRYALRIELLPPFERVTGTLALDVSLEAVPADLVLDWRGDSTDHALRDLRVNGQRLAPIPYANDHLVVPRATLRAGANRIEVAFSAPVRAAGAALTRYRDATDGSEYVYSLLVPAEASTLFPCFDQPDLKARFALELAVPEAWRAVSNGREIARAAEAGVARYRFAPTEPISTYLFAFAAGPFAELDDPGSDLRLLVRRSKLDRARAEAGEIFRLHREALRWLESYFAQPYAYRKLDVVLVPELAYGGMEHAGAIFLREDSVLFPFEPSDADQLRRAQLVFHEAAHQWFGDLVTMRWFDDLWLKEGFANLMAAKAAAALLPEHDAWNAFRALKIAAYRTDETRGTTPIWQALPNLNAAKSAYGSIVYSKAPAILRQLEFYLGEEAFRAGVGAFLAQHAHGAADWNDLLAAFEGASGENLQTWARAWVTGAGLPRVTLDWQLDGDGRVARLEVVQEEPLRPFRSRLLIEHADGTHSVHTVTLGEAPRVAVPGTVGRPKPRFAFANDGDYGYGLFRLDPDSRRYLLAHLGQVQDQLLRALLWDALWEEVRATIIAPSEWIAVALRELPGERDDVTVSGVLGRLQTAFRFYLSEVQRETWAPQLEAALRSGMLEAPARSLRIHYFRAFAAVASSASGRATLKQLLAGDMAVPGVRLSASDRYRILRRLLAVSDPDARDLLSTEARRDAGDDARRFAYAAGAAEPDARVKQRYFDAFLHERELAESWIEEALPAFNMVEHSEITRVHLQSALASLPELSTRHKIFFVNAWLAAFVGGQTGASALAMAEQAAADPALTPALRRKLLEVTDELARTVAIRRAAGSQD
jgi:aminopeptidase N